MNKKPDRPRVAIATGVTREDAVRNALALVRDELLDRIQGAVIVKPNFLSSVNTLAATQAGAVRPVLEMLRNANIDRICIAEGGSRSTPQALDNFGYRALASDFAVDFVDLNRGGFSRSFEIITADRKTQNADYADFAAEADTIISVPVAKTHDTAGVTLSVKNMMGCLRRVHRPRMHGFRIGDSLSGIAERFWNAIEGHPFVFKSFSGAVFAVARMMRAQNRHGAGHGGTGLLQQVGAMSENLARLGRVLMPDIAVIDAFEAMEGDGPGSVGTPVDMRVAVAGTDPVACDAVMAYMMGFDPGAIGHIALLGERGLGVADLTRIECVGESPEHLRRGFRPHANFPIQRRWREAFDSWPAEIEHG